MTVAPSNEQDRALNAIADWYGTVGHGGMWGHQWFTLLGAAGTGKTTTAKGVAARLGLPAHRVQVAAYTGKAAHVLRRKGLDARTLHNLLYRPAGERVPVDEKTGLPIPGVKPTPGFKLNEVSDLAGAKLLVVDEVSMVGEKMAEDILSFKVPVLVLGDRYQLPPVRGTGYFVTDTPDFELTEIHRQAAGSPVITMATAVREGRLRHVRQDLGHGTTYGIPVHGTTITRDTQFIVGSNRERWTWNMILRGFWGLDEDRGHVPVPGDKVIGLQNNRDLGVLNGQQFTVVSCAPGRNGHLALRVLDDDGVERTVPAWREPFVKLKGHDEVRVREGYGDQQAAAFLTWGWAITCHKSQGSQWDDVVVVVDSYARSAGAKWLYTAVTRAAERVRVIGPNQWEED